ncbi:Uncharacterized protein APZ42_004580 [Daphnia magna]|uniref:Reverse transcriptase domain-containing protein n=1 Tax=Daphnia magna TaxID=35525 RepID=A0A162C080_9CRUS|nr:Uncharacterized protein APZ42_004580 [Daphnia magna]
MEEEKVYVCDERQKREAVDLVVGGVEGNEELIIGNDICEYLAEQSPSKRRGWMPVRVDGPRTILPNSLMFVNGRLPSGISWRGFVKFNSCSKPGKEWVIPSSIVDIREGIVKIDIVNYASVELKWKRRHFLCVVEADEDVELSGVSESGGIPEVGVTLISEDHFSKLAPQIRMGEKLSPLERAKIVELLERRQKCFPASKRAIGHTTDVVHHSDTGDARPIKSVPYRVSAFESQIIADKVEEMLEDGIIEEFYSPWSSPVVLVRKAKSGEYRICVDFRRLNAVTKRDVYPLPRIDDVLDRLAIAQFFSCLDLASGYWQVLVAVEDREKTAFVTPNGLYQFSCLPLGLNCAPATFQRLMDKVLACLKWHMCLVYLDDVLVFGKTYEEHLARLELVLTALEQANLTLPLEKF